MSVMYYVNYITTALELISAALLAIEIVLIPAACSKTRKYSFFKCFIFYGCFGLLSWAVTFQLLRSIGSSSLAYLSINCFLSGFSLHGYLLSSMLLTLNRFSCIVFPLSFSALWTDTRCFIYMIVVVCVTLLSVCYRIGAPIHVVWLEDLQTYRWTGYPRTIHVISLAFTLSICFFVTFGSLIINTWSFICWKKYKNTVSKSVYHSQRNMFIFSVLTFGFSSCICIQQLVANAVMFSGNLQLAAVLVDLYFPLSAIAILVDPYSLLILSPGLRKEVVKLFNRARGRNVVDVVGTSHISQSGVTKLKQKSALANGGGYNRSTHGVSRASMCF